MADTPTIQQVFIQSEQALSNVVAQIRDNQWTMLMPADFPSYASKPQSLREVINYHAYDDAWVPDTVAGKTIDAVGTTYDGDLLGNDPQTAWKTITSKAVAAVEALQPADLERIAHLTYGDFPVREYLRHIISFRALRAVDIARVIGVDDQLPQGLAQAVWDLLVDDIEAWRKIGVYGPAVDVPADANIQAKLMGLTGRQPFTATNPQTN